MKEIVTKIELNTIYNEDCLQGMKRIPDGAVDCIICDLPYGVLNKGNQSAQWDNIIPFEPLWEQYERVIKDDGAIVLFASGMFTADLMTSNRKLWRYNLIWKKGKRSTGFLNANKMPLRNHEDIVVFYKKSPTYNPQMTKGTATHHRSGSQSAKNQCTRGCKYSYAAHVTGQEVCVVLPTFLKVLTVNALGLLTQFPRCDTMMRCEISGCSHGNFQPLRIFLTSSFYEAPAPSDGVPLVTDGGWACSAESSRVGHRPSWRLSLSCSFRQTGLKAFLLGGS